MVPSHTKPPQTLSDSKGILCTPSPLNTQEPKAQGLEPSAREDLCYTALSLAIPESQELESPDHGSLIRDH
jgi:hypothetical protein